MSETYSLQPTAYSLIHVIAGALFDSVGRVLIAQRPDGKHMAGGWEFPGGKLEPDEDEFEGLKRELREELGVEVHAAEPLIAYEHAYADRRVLPRLVDRDAASRAIRDRSKASRCSG